MEPLFNNDNIKYRGKTLYFGYWVKSGVKFIYDIYKDGQMKTQEEIRAMVGRDARFDLDYNALINALPQAWKLKLINNVTRAVIRDAVSANSLANDSISKFLNKTNKDIRLLMVEKRNVEICGRKFWMNKTGTDIINRYNIATISTKESRLRLLHFKICHNIYPSNILLKQMRIKTTDLCEHCGMIDYIEHMFIYCSLLDNYWNDVFRLIHIKTSTLFPITETNILFGINSKDTTANTKQLQIANHIILIAKMCVGKIRYGKSQHLKTTFEMEISQREKYII